MPGSRYAVGLTGGIASGKSTVAALFAALGVPVIDMDDIAREVVLPGSATLERVYARFGLGVRGADGQLNRRALREIVFPDATARRDLEAIMHPAIQARCEQLAAAAVGPYHVIVHPLIAETGTAGRFDRILLVDCDERLQRQRLAQRDGSSAPQVEAALAAQATRASRQNIANDVILNEGDAAALAPQVQKLHQQYLHLAQRR